MGNKLCRLLLELLLERLKLTGKVVAISEVLEL